jgi:DNA-directed RNA polymerase subunit RPC12/RpoP
VSPRRYRCAACGNLTRFDVTTTRRTRSFHHYTVGGDLQIEEEQVLSETVEEVACRWCGSGRAIEELDEQSDDQLDDQLDAAGLQDTEVADGPR